MRLILLLILFIHAQAWAGPAVSEIAEKVGPSVVTITTFNREGLPLSSGSGFFLTREGDLVTSRHVLSGCDRAVVRAPKGTEGEILFISKADPRLDLVVAGTSFKNTTPLTLGNSDDLSIGDPIVCMGNPPGLPGALSLGEVRHLRKIGEIQLIQMTAPVLPGCSGGPVFNALGEVVGITTAFLHLDPGLNFALSVNELEALKPVRVALPRLPKMSVRFEAVMHEEQVVDVWVGENPSQARKSYQTPETLRHRRPTFQSKSRENPDPGIQQGNGAVPGTVYFRNGRTLLCDRAWKQGSTVYLLLHGKRFVLGYEQSSIDMKRSFDSSL